MSIIAASRKCQCCGGSHSGDCTSCCSFDGPDPKNCQYCLNADDPVLGDYVDQLYWMTEVVEGRTDKVGGDCVPFDNVEGELCDGGLPCSPVYGACEEPDFDEECGCCARRTQDIYWLESGVLPVVNNIDIPDCPNVCVFTSGYDPDPFAVIMHQRRHTGAACINPYGGCGAGPYEDFLRAEDGHGLFRANCSADPAEYIQWEFTGGGPFSSSCATWLNNAWQDGVYEARGDEDCYEIDFFFDSGCHVDKSNPSLCVWVHFKFEARLRVNYVKPPDNDCI